MMEKEYMTISGFEKLKGRLAFLEGELLVLQKYKGEEAINAGDNWHDNPTLYAVELKERGLINEIALLKKRISSVEVKSALGGSEEVVFGTKMRIKFSDGTSAVFQILGEADSDSTQNIISYLSPLGKALMGKKVEEKATYKVGNEEIGFEVMEIIS